MDHYSDGIRRRHSSPVVSDGGLDELGKNVGHNDFHRHKQRPRSSDSEEAQWESSLVSLFTTVWQQFQCAVLTICTIPMSTRTLSSTGRRHNDSVVRWNNIVRSLASRYAVRMILMDLEYEMRLWIKPGSPLIE